MGLFARVAVGVAGIAAVWESAILTKIWRLGVFELQLISTVLEFGVEVYLDPLLRRREVAVLACPRLEPEAWATFASSFKKYSHASIEKS